MKDPRDPVREHLGDLGSLMAKTHVAEQAILKRAEQRLAEVQAELGKIAPGIEGAPDADQDRYLNLVKERGQLHQVIAKSKAALGT